MRVRGIGVVQVKFVEEVLAGVLVLGKTFTPTVLDVEEAQIVSLMGIRSLLQKNVGDGLVLMRGLHFIVLVL